VDDKIRVDSCKLRTASKQIRLTRLTTEFVLWFKKHGDEGVTPVVAF